MTERGPLRFRDVPSLSAPTVELDTGRLVEIATAAWRLREKVAVDSGLRRYVDGVLDALAEAGVGLRSYSGDSYDPGMALRVIAFQPAPGLERDEVIETLRPSVYLRGRLIALGEVIVGVPVGTEDMEKSE